MVGAGRALIVRQVTPIFVGGETTVARLLPTANTTDVTRHLHSWVLPHNRNTSRWLGG